VKRVLLAIALAACSQPSESFGTARSRIVKGTDSDDSQNAVVLVMHYDALAAGGGAASGCTGTMLAPRLLLTARHCVSITDDGAACDSKGDAITGGKVMGDHEPSKIYVFGGKTRPDFLSGQFDPSRGKEILTTGSSTLCNNDIALVVLDKPVSGATIAPVRLDAGVTKGEMFTAVGWGISDTEDNPQSRKQRTGIAILDVGPQRDLGPSELRAGEGTCAGDSGGPALSEQGAVIATLSRGGNGTKDTGAASCLGGTNIFTSTAGHADFLRAGYAGVNAPPWIEGEPRPMPDAGTSMQPSPTPEDGCNASARGPLEGVGSEACLASALGVLFVLRRRGNTAKARKNTG
jgi:hypothetical protein